MSKLNGIMVINKTCEEIALQVTNRLGMIHGIEEVLDYEG